MHEITTVRHVCPYSRQSNCHVCYYLLTENKTKAAFKKSYVGASYQGTYCTLGSRGMSRNAWILDINAIILLVFIRLLCPISVYENFNTGKNKMLCWGMPLWGLDDPLSYYVKRIPTLNAFTIFSLVICNISSSCSVARRSISNCEMDGGKEFTLYLNHKEFVGKFG